MIVLLILALATEAPIGTASERSGAIRGVVVNGTRDHAPIGGAAVVLRAVSNGAFMPVAETRSDELGHFAFVGLPLDPTIVYLPGADRDGVHYPGQRVSLDGTRESADARIVAFDAVAMPSPLVARRHEININILQDLMEVTETLMISNPSKSTYIGEGLGDQDPVTLSLSIPASFDRVTFAREFYGRRFRILDHRPVTDIPWTPGERELTFSYRVPLNGSGGTFRRPLDLSCDYVRLQVQGESAEKISSNLRQIQVESAATQAFAAVGEHLSADFVLELHLGMAPVPWRQYARWSALAVLILGSIATAALGQMRA